MKQKILVVEDEVDISRLISVNLSATGYEVVCVNNVEKALSFIYSDTPDLCIFDWMLPDQTGLYLLRKLRSQSEFLEIPIMMLTARSSENDKVMAFEHGADDYMTKPFSPRELLVRIQALLRRSTQKDDEKLLIIGDMQICQNTHTVRYSNTILRLQPMEFKILFFFLKKPSWIFSRSQLIKSLWPGYTSIEERTVDAHIMNLRKAIDRLNHKLKIETVRGEGYRLKLLIEEKIC